MVRHQVFRLDDDVVYRTSNQMSGRAGAVLQAGVVHGGVHLHGGEGDVVEGAYLAQVRTFAPAELVGRENELALLAEFCVQDLVEERYLWWRAVAWSGKSALLATFVLDPPPGVRVVSFFVRSQQQDQRTRRAFVDIVTEQLTELLGLRPRSDRAEASREPHLLRLLEKAADAVRREGERLVLVVDGLDEDHGVDGSLDAFSIAALLPPSGVRVIVAGRPDPDIPVDVAESHPLRTSARVVHLSPSPAAVAVRGVMTSDLKRLLASSQASRDILGFITASSGGLSLNDLAELTSSSTWQVEDYLSTAAGRSFSRRPGEPVVYFLAHEGLHALATEMLRPELPAYRSRISAWATTYRDQDWPATTPRYLLQGYASTLIESDDRSRLINHLTDTSRNERGYTVFGDHRPVLSEMEAAQAHLLDDEEPDLLALARLSVHRMSLYTAEVLVPVQLPKLWLRAGDTDHAESLIAQISEPVRRCRALMAAAEELHKLDQPRHAARMLDEAETITLSINQYWGVYLHHDLAGLALRVGDDSRAARVAADIGGNSSASEAYARLALTAIADKDEAAKWYRSALEAWSRRKDDWAPFGISLTPAPAQLAAMAAASQALGYAQRAADFIDELRSLESAPRTALQVRDVVGILMRGGLDEVAISYARTNRHICTLGRSLLDIVENVARSSRLGEAEDLARTNKDASSLAAALAVVALNASQQGDTGWATRLYAEVVAILPDIPDDELGGLAKRAATRVRADLGNYADAAEQVLAEMLASGDTIGAMWVAESLIDQSEIDRTIRILHAVEGSVSPGPQHPDIAARVSWVQVMAAFGDVKRAETVAQQIHETDAQGEAWESIATCHAHRGNVDGFTEAMSYIAHPAHQRAPRLEMIRSLTSNGLKTTAVEIARQASEATHRASALCLIAERFNDQDLANEAANLASESDDLRVQAQILISTLQCAAGLRAKQLADHALRRLNAIDKEVDAHRRSAKETGAPHSTPWSGELYSTFLPKLLPSFNEIIERTSTGPRSHGPEDKRPQVSVGMPPMWLVTSSESKQKAYAKSLAIGNWIDVIDRIVDIDANVYSAIVQELDKLSSGSIFGEYARTIGGMTFNY